MNIRAGQEQSFSINSSGELVRRAVWHLYARDRSISQTLFNEKVKEWCGRTGEPLRVPSEDGTPLALADCPVTGISARNTANLAAEVTFEAVCVNASPVFRDERSQDGTYRRTAAYRAAAVSADTILPVPGAMLVWDERQYICEKSSAAPFADGWWEITVTAAETASDSRMLSCVRYERFAGFDRAGNSRMEIVWESIWRVNASKLGEFTGLAGYAADWADSNSIITSVSPKKISDAEYELQIEAESLNNPGLYEKYSGDDRSDLGSRRDITAGMVDFLLTPAMAGRQYAADGTLEEIPDWQPGENCPLEADGYLPENMVNRALKCILLEETSYSSGSISSNMSELLSWSTAARVYDGTVGGCRGSFLRIDMEAREITDNSGKCWTRFTGSWQLAPAGCKWNSAYWGSV